MARFSLQLQLFSPLLSFDPVAKSAREGEKGGFMKSTSISRRDLLLSAAGAALMAGVPNKAAAVGAPVARYQLKLWLQIPRVYNNMQSRGYRKMQKQLLNGIVEVRDIGADEPEVSVSNLVNLTHLVGDQNVTYRCSVLEDETMWRYIGNNATNVFRRACIRFSVDCDPSYNIGEDEPDNALIIQLAGTGTSDSRISGNVTGQIGCGCHAYGHVSPTRTRYGDVDDRVPTFGRFTMKQIS